MNGADSPAAPPKEARRATATSHSEPWRFNSTSLLTGSKPSPNTMCVSSCLWVCLHSLQGWLWWEQGMWNKKGEKRLLVIAKAEKNVWKRDHCRDRMTDWRRDWSFFTPTVSNLSVHSLLQFNHSSHCQESPHHPPPPSPSRTRRILCIHAAAHSTHRLKQCLQHDLQFVSGLERCPSCCKQHRLHTLITLATGFFTVRVFYGRDPQTSGTHLELFNERLSLPDSLLRAHHQSASFSSCQETSTLISFLAKAKQCRYMNDNSL